jgi:hypothetical protein
VLSVFTRKGIAIVLAYLAFLTLASILFLGVLLVHTFESDTGVQVTQPSINNAQLNRLEGESMAQCRRRIGIHYPSFSMDERVNVCRIDP